MDRREARRGVDRSRSILLCTWLEVYFWGTNPKLNFSHFVKRLFLCRGRIPNILEALSILTNFKRRDEFSYVMAFETEIIFPEKLFFPGSGKRKSPGKDGEEAAGSENDKNL